MPPTGRREGADLVAVEQHVDDRVGLDVVGVLEDELHGAVAVLGLLSADLGAQDLGAHGSTFSLIVGQLVVRGDLLLVGGDVCDGGNVAQVEDEGV